MNYKKLALYLLDAILKNDNKILIDSELSESALLEAFSKHYPNQLKRFMDSNSEKLVRLKPENIFDGTYKGDD